MDHNNVNPEKVDIKPFVAANNSKKMKAETLDTQNMILLKNDYEKKDHNDNERVSNKNINGMLTSSESDRGKSLPFKLSSKSIGGSTESEMTKLSEQMEENQINNIYEIEKQMWGCSWSDLTKHCQHGDSCPFVWNILDLPTVGSSRLPPTLSRVADARQYAAGLCDISSQQRVYRPPPNSNIVKVPLVSTSKATALHNGEGGEVCDDCDSNFADNKSLVKHKRNMHQVYQCSQCGESTIGYYSMASHTKKRHHKEPVFYCNCGRNFAEKRGLTKHQNSCTFYKNS